MTGEIVYTGNWIKVEELGRGLQPGDLVMCETQENIYVAHIDEIDEKGRLVCNTGAGVLFIPRGLILCAKEAQAEIEQQDVTVAVTKVLQHLHEVIKLLSRQE